MKKENAILKIQRVGRIGALMSKVLLVLLCIGFVLILLANVTIFVLPKELKALTVDVESTVHVLLPDFDALLRRFGQDGDLATLYAMEALPQESGTTVELLEDGLHVETVAPLQQFSLGQLRFLFPLLLLYVALMGLSLWFVKELCKALASCQSPFDPLVIRRLQQLAFSLLPWTLAGVLNQVGASSLYNAGHITISLNLSSVLVALLLLGLAYIFKYGAILQQESDETL